jgi:hypothetical protein
MMKRYILSYRKENRARAKRIPIWYLIILLFSFSSVAKGATDKWNEAKSTHFIVYYKNAPEDFINQVINKSEDYYNKIADDLGFRRFDFWLWENRAQVYIYDGAQEYRAATGQPEWSAGAVMPGAKVIQTFPYARGFFETILPHEMGHIIFREFVGFNNYAIPLWLEEGVASYQEKSKYSFANKIIQDKMKQGKFMNLGQLSNFDIQNIKDSEQVELFYLESYSIVDYLIKEFGRDKFVSLCQNLRDRKDLSKAMASAYLFNFQDIQALDRLWQEYVKNE